MGSELLQKEKEYHELNKKLEIQTKELLQEVDSVMKFQENVLTNDIRKFDPKQYLMDSTIHKNHCLHKSTTKNVFQLDAQDYKELNIPEDANNMGMKGLAHFLKGKIKKMQFDYDKLQIEYKNKNDEFKKIEKENIKLVEDKDKWFQVATANKNQIAKIDSQVLMLRSKIQTKDNENASLKKEVEQLQKECKAGKLNISSTELRMHKMAEECDKNKAALKNIKQEEKELRETHRKQLNDLTTIIKRIEKHKTELLNGFKKQLLLIDNLKKQKTHIECYKLTEKAESDFTKILDWKMDEK